jgi:hypothetical protein
MILNRVVIVALTVAVAILDLAGCGSSPTLTLPENKWVLVKSKEPPIYVRFVGVSVDEYIFQSSDEPFEERNPKSMPKKYAMGHGVIGKTVILGQRTTRYDVTPPKVESTEFLRFDIVSYDQATNVVTIRLLKPVP